MSRIFKLIDVILKWPLYLYRIYVKSISNEKELRKIQKEIPKERDQIINKNREQHNYFFYRQLYINCKEKGVTYKKRDPKIIVSLTSFGPRFNDLYLTIESIFQQSVKPDHVILNISKEHYAREDLPQTLIDMEERGLMIQFTRNLGPYKKLIPTLENFKNDLIVTMDDDVYYPEYVIDRLLKSYLSEPYYVHCLRAHKMTLDQEGAILPYREWDFDTEKILPGFDIFPTGVGGVLYFPGCFTEEVLDEKAFQELCPTNDDIWLKAMSLRKNIKCKRVTIPRSFEQDFVTIGGSQVQALWQDNVRRDTNDSQIKATFKRYELDKKFSADE